MNKLQVYLFSFLKKNALYGALSNVLLVVTVLLKTNGAHYQAVQEPKGRDWIGFSKHRQSLDSLQCLVFKIKHLVERSVIL